MANILKFKGKATSEEKLKALILYIPNKKGPMTYGALCTMLWEIDAQAFITTGKSITDTPFFNFNH